MSIDMLYGFIASIQLGSNRTVSDAMILLREAFSDNKADAAAFGLPLLNRLLGVPAEILQSLSKRYWEYSFTLTTDSGEWDGFSNSMIRATSVDGYNICASALTVSAVWDRGGDVFGYGDVIAHAGAATLGHSFSLKDLPRV
jgi:hypothetical protein